MPKARSNITEKTAKILFAKHAGRCAFPDCGEFLINRKETKDGQYNESLFGEICHIIGKKDNAPRGASNMSSTARNHIDNLILLCANHHNIIDKAPEIYPVEMLRNMKKQHEHWVHNRLASGEVIDESCNTYLNQYLKRFSSPATIPNIFSEHSTIVLNDIFVEVGVSESDAEYEDNLKIIQHESHLLMAMDYRFKERESRKVSLDSLLNDSSAPLKVILGDPGSGKSTLLKYMAYKIAQKSFTNYTIPFLIPLRDYVSLCGKQLIPFLDFVIKYRLSIKDKQTKNKLSKHLIEQGNNKRVVFLLDGFDEVSVIDNIGHQLKSEITSLAINFNIILSSRRAGFKTDLGTYKIFELIDLSPSSIKSLIKNWFQQVVYKDNDFIETFKKWVFSQPSITSLAKNPFLLSLLCYLNQNRKKDNFLQVQNSAQIYNEAMEILKKDFKEKYQKDFPKSSEQTLFQFALYLFSSISGPKQLFLHNDYIKFCDNLSVKDSNVLNDYWLHSKLINQWNSQETYHFIHLTFQEWSVARRLYTNNIQESSAIIQHFIYSPYWKQVFKFYAGLCALDKSPSNGLKRFKTLINPILKTPDLFELHLFWLAPLISEFQTIGDTNILNFDLRNKLLKIVNTMPHNSSPYIKIMVTLDPEYYLEVSLFAINRYLKREGCQLIQVAGYSHIALYPDDLFEELSEIELASNILKYIYHPAATDILKQLMNIDITDDTEMTEDNTDKNFSEVYTPISNALHGHVNEHIKETIRSDFINEQDIVNKLDILFFLKNLTDKDNADAIYNEAVRIDDLEFNIECVKSLAEMQDVRALELADILWENNDFIENEEYFDDVIIQIQNIQSPLTEQLLENWLQKTRDPRLIIEIIFYLNQTHWSSDYEFLLPYLKVKDEDTRLNTLLIITRRGKEKTIDLLTEYLLDNTIRPSFKRELVYQIADQKLFASEEPFVQWLNTLDPQADPEIWIQAWFCYTMLHDLPDTHHQKIIKYIILDKFKQAVELFLPAQISVIDQWFSALMNCSETIQDIAAPIILGYYSEFTDDGKIVTLEIIEKHPVSCFTELALAEINSPNYDIRQLACGIIAKVAPDKALQLKKQQPLIMKELYHRAILEDTLFFADYFIDQAGNKVPYNMSLDITINSATQP